MIYHDISFMQMIAAESPRPSDLVFSFSLAQALLDSVLGPGTSVAERPYKQTAVWNALISRIFTEPNIRFSSPSPSEERQARS